jgi:hypothetical protein
VFNNLKVAAEETDPELLISAPANLFRVDPSFVYDKNKRLPPRPMILPNILQTQTFPYS